MVDFTERFVVVGCGKVWVVLARITGGDLGIIQGMPGQAKIWSCEGDAQEYVRLVTGDYCPTISV